MVGDSSRKSYSGDMTMIANAYQHVCYALGHHGAAAKPLDAILLSCEEKTIELKSAD